LDVIVFTFFGEGKGGERDNDFEEYLGTVPLWVRGNIYRLSELLNLRARR